MPWLHWQVMRMMSSTESAAPAGDHPKRRETRSHYRFSLGRFCSPAGSARSAVGSAAM